MTERIVCGADNTSLKPVWYDETSRNDFETFFRMRCLCLSTRQAKPLSIRVTNIGVLK